jgi:NADPH-dependent curcumin reductase CurA
MPTYINRRFLLASRPTDLPSDANFRIESKAMPALEGGQVLVRVLIAALSPWQGQRLKDFENYTQPFEIGELIDCDVLGQVISGEADGLKRGDLVTGRLGWQEYAAAKPEYLSPATTEFDETLWLTALSSPGLTAYSAMEMFGRPMPGQTIVVTSAAGSVGSYAIQLAKLAGMTVVGIAGGAEKCRVVSELLGADACLDHRMPDLASRLRETCPEGVHLFLDTVGGWIGDAVFESLAKFAKVLIVGRTISNNSTQPNLDPVNMRMLWAREASIQCFSRYSYPDRWEFARERMMSLCRNDKITTIDNVINGFEQTPTALHDMLAGNYTGKVMVRYAEAEG